MEDSIMFGKLLSYRQQGSKVDLLFENQKMVIEAFQEQILNIFVPLRSKEHDSKAVNFANKAEVNLKVCWEDESVVIQTSEITAKIYHEGKVDIYNKDGVCCCRDYRWSRVPAPCMSQETKKLLESEGHKVEDEGVSHKIEVVKAMEGDELFYGLGDKTGFLNKRHYVYEMWNTDNPDPQVDNFKVLYKTIPFFMTKRKDCVYGLFFDNTYRSVFNMGKESERYFYYGVDEGNLDYYYIAGDCLSEVLTNYGKLTGTVPVPQLWTLGYHQSRWGYEWESEVRDIAQKLREYHIPCDTIHLDIDYMDNFKVFTWNQERYEDPKQMIMDLSEDGFKIVTIIDPGVKLEEGYDIYDTGIKNGYFVRDKEGNVYDNWVWPGASVFPDFGNPDVRRWWSENQKFLVDMGVRGVWNDMNEPASFHGEIPTDVVFTDEGRVTNHGEMHNVYGHLMAKATYEGLKHYDKRRPFIITRACYSGTQKYSTAWTGDNHSIWCHLQMAIPQLCNLGMSGMPYVGTDVGGFGSDTTPELLTRWVQVGCFSPLFRNHTAKGTRFQEPWAFGNETLDIYRKYVKLRYKLLPYFYDLFYEAEQRGLPIMRPLVLHYEDDANVQNLNDQFMVGEQIIVAPVVNQGQTMRMVYLPEGIWYDYWTREKRNGGYFLKEAPLDTCPIYIKAGSIIPNFPDMEYVGQKDVKQLTLDVLEGEGSYIHYQDDGESFAYREGEYNQYQFTVHADGRFRIELLHHGYEPIYESFRILYKDKEIEVPFCGEEIKMNL